MSAPLHSSSVGRDRAADVQKLWRQRPRDAFLRWSTWALAGLVVTAWAMGGFSFADWFSARRLENAKRFITQDAAPHTDSLSDWISQLWMTHGAEGLKATLAISVLAIVLAAIWALCLAPLTARVVMSRDPWMKEGGHPALRLTRQVVRLLCIALRAIPEYVLAFLLLAILGQGAWPAVLALALHNAGILGRLGGETLENLEKRPMRALRGLGASRASILVHGGLALALPRFMLYLFYRFETCVREATVLGMLGVVSLGYWIADARVRMRYDEMVFLIGLSVLLVIAADALSWFARRAVRRM